MAEWKKVVVSGSSAELSGLSLDTALTVANGGTGASTLTDGGILLGSGAGAITATSVLAEGQLLIGDGTGDPTLANLSTTTGNNNTGSLKITNGTGTITLSVDEQSIGIGNLSSSNAATAGNVLKVSADGQHITYGSAASGDVTEVITPTNGGLSISDTSDSNGKVAITMSISDLAAETSLQDVDTFAFDDVSDTTSVVTTKKVTLANLSSSIIGNIDGDVDIAGTGVSTINADAVEGSMLNSNVVGLGLVQGADNALSMSINDLTAAVVNVANDSIAFVDADDSNATRKESISDLVSAQAGKGLSEASGQFNVELTSNAGLGFTGVGAAGTVGLDLDTTTGNHSLQMDSNGLSLRSTIEGNRTFEDDVTVSGNLNVAGTASFNHSTNLSVADKYILLNSGSAGANLDSGGIVIGGPNDNGKGELFGFISGSTESSDGINRRWAVVADFDADSAGDFTAEAFMSTVTLSSVESDTNPDSVSAKYKKAGNIFIDQTEGTPYIYV
jgi:hypothetical protein